MAAETIDTRECLMEIQNTRGTTTSRLIEIDYRLVDPPSKLRIRNKYLQEYRQKLGIQLSTQREKLARECHISVRDLDNAIRLTSSLESTHRRAIRHNETHALQIVNTQRLSKQPLKVEDERLHYLHDYNRMQHPKNFILNNAIFNTLIDNLEQRSQTKYLIMDSKGLPSIHPLELIQQDDDEERLRSKKAYPSGRLFFSSGRANTHRARTSALRAESGGSTFSVAGLHQRENSPLSGNGVPITNPFNNTWSANIYARSQSVEPRAKSNNQMSILAQKTKNLQELKKRTKKLLPISSKEQC